MICLQMRPAAEITLLRRRAEFKIFELGQEPQHNLDGFFTCL